MYLIPLGILLAAGAPSVAVAPDWTGFLSNLVPVTLGNIAGGSIMVAAVYHLIYNHALRPAADRLSGTEERRAPQERP
jgi:formate/nitrite transporter FocA (FNT family)